jgi:hypothetical protein
MVLVNFRTNLQFKVLGFAYEEQVNAPFAPFGKETEFRFNHRRDDFYSLLIREFRKSPL